MIAHLQGKLLRKSVDSVIIDIGGIGYQLYLSLNAMSQLPVEGEEVSLWVYTHVREDAIQLYGFFDLQEQQVFERLIQISGVGPRLARNVLSGIGADDLVAAIEQGATGRLQSIPGVGRKLAERMIVELREKFQQEPLQARGLTPVDKMQEEALSALIHLGYKKREAEKAIRDFSAAEKDRELNIQAIVKGALRQLTHEWVARMTK